MQAPEEILNSIEKENLAKIKANGGLGLDQITGALADLTTIMQLLFIMRFNVEIPS